MEEHSRVGQMPLAFISCPFLGVAQTHRPSEVRSDIKPRDDKFSLHAAVHLFNFLRYGLRG